MAHVGTKALAVCMLLLPACESAPPATSPPVAPSATVATAATPPALATATACLMTHICGCNMGCARIAVDPAQLKEGMHATAQTGTYAGKDMIVVKETDAAGGSVFALSDRDHAMACERDLPASTSLLGFACATKDSGSVPAHACATGCD